MRMGVGSALVLAALLAGCSDGRQSGLNTFAMATPEQTRQGNADPSFRLNDLRIGLTKAELEALYPNRLVLGSDAETVVRTSPVPVLLVRSEEAPR